MIRRPACILLCLFLGTCVLGCQGAPEYAGTKSKADNELSLGWGRSLRLGAETDATLEGFETANGTKIDKLTLKSSPAQTMAGGWVPAMDAYGRQQVNFVPILKQYGDNAIGITNAVFAGLNQLATTTWAGVNEAIATAAPVFTQYLAGRNMQRQAEAMKPSIIDEVVRLGVAGRIDPIAAGSQLPADWQAEIQTRVRDELSRAMAAALPPIDPMEAAAIEAEAAASSQPDNP